MEKIIISLGGSLIVPGVIDIEFLKEFRNLILSRSKQFILICGGGSVARKYQEAYKKIRDGDENLMDQIGISATHLNASLVKSIFHENSENTIIENPNTINDFNKKIQLACGWKPGFSTDYDAVIIAKKLGVKKIINMSNIDFVYDKDPKKYSDAKPLDKISWSNFRALVGDIWSPGLNMPFDPVAAKEAESLGLEVNIIGKDINNLKNLLEKKEFIGTTIN